MRPRGSAHRKYVSMKFTPMASLRTSTMPWEQGGRPADRAEWCSHGWDMRLPTNAGAAGQKRRTPLPGRHRGPGFPPRI
jgi:hypothetical protein